MNDHNQICLTIGPIRAIISSYERAARFFSVLPTWTTHVHTYNETLIMLSR